ncbi:ACP S-malonyltransferase [Acidithrix ferrooxidans]|uniref:Uncharacterized protein n=1 Tax=Acidithrix ferrooxidans TaxID=1280514 RepID=A0A0D8HI11_9ACTN|nr:hypothetical protein [Acidithrix ferrooxidans]KJF17489.1 hypothetical protein AXFE_16520 [Acidithrix ferrooxidans]
MGALAVSAAAIGVSATTASAQSASSGSGSSSITSGRLLPADWVAQASPYDVTRGYFAYLSPDFAKVSSPQEYSAVKQMIQIYDAAPMAAKTVGFQHQCDSLRNTHQRAELLSLICSLGAGVVAGRASALRGGMGFNGT